MTRKTLSILSCFVVLSAAPAFAQEEEGELVESVVVRNRLFTVANKFELGLNFGAGLMPKMVDTYVLNLAVAYNVLEWLALELRGGWSFGGLTSLARQIQRDYTTAGTASDAADAWQMTGHGVFGLRFQPVYGKLNLFGEGTLHFQFYLWVGGGVTGLRKESLVACPGGSQAECLAWAAGDRTAAVSPFSYDADQSGTWAKVSPLASLALGFRFLFGREAHHAARLEVRTWSFLDSYYTNINKASVNGDANPTGGGIEYPTPGITNIATVDIGYTYIF